MNPLSDKFSKGIVISVVLLNVVFAGIVLYIFKRVGSEPVALITAWFAFTTGELWMLSSIKKSKIKNGGEKCDRLEKEINE